MTAMYIPAHFAESRPEVLHELVRRHPLGMLVTHGAAGLDANHIPFELDAASGSLGTLYGNKLEASNVDLSKEMVNMIVYQRNYQSNSQTIKTQSELLQTLVNLG